MKEVENIKRLEPGTTYYLEYKLSPWQRADPDNYSYKLIGKFDRYEDTTYDMSTDYTTELFEPQTTAFFEDVKSVNDKPPHESLGVINSSLQFAVAPHGCAYTIYQQIKGLREEAARRIKGLREEAARRMINSQYPLSENNPLTYEETPVKNRIGDDLSKEIGKYFGGKKSRKTRKSRKSRKTKSRRRR